MSVNERLVTMNIVTLNMEELQDRFFEQATQASIENGLQGSDMRCVFWVTIGLIPSFHAKGTASFKYDLAMYGKPDVDTPLVTPTTPLPTPSEMWW